jgi:predicted  nucleic acid-binding Zn-ribbon protein
MNRYQQLEQALDFHNNDVDQTAADVREIKRRQTATTEAFRTMRQQIDAFEQSILRDYAAIEARLSERLDRLGDDGEDSAKQITGSLAASAQEGAA